MNDEKSSPIDVRTASSQEVAAAITRGVRKALAHHKRIGNSVVVWDHETETTRLVPPEEIPDFPSDDLGPDSPSTETTTPDPERS
jgi:hypothetical protein